MDLNESARSQLSPVPGLVLGGILLLLAILRMPYGYYVFIRWIACAGFAYGAFVAYKLEQYGWVWLLGAGAVLFNPIFPFRMHRTDWRTLDLVGSGLSFSAAFWFQRRLMSRTTKGG
jgi:hypothetical protein